jgi:branched-chain amino acid aminotransferase
MPSTPTPLPPKEGIEFESLPWNLNLPDEHSYIHLTTESGEWTIEHYDPATDTGLLFDSVKNFSEQSLPFSTPSLNYGTTIWEGLKCFRDKDGKTIVFRPDRNFHRFANGAEQMCLPKPSRELFLRGVQHVVQQNSHLIPPCGEGMKLYIRPMLLGSGQQLGLYPSPQFSLLFYVSPTVRLILWAVFILLAFVRDTQHTTHSLTHSLTHSMHCREITSRMPREDSTFIWKPVVLERLGEDWAPPSALVTMPLL